MPRNEEETYKSLLELSRHVQTPHDLPHVNIHFESIHDDTIFFTTTIVAPRFCTSFQSDSVKPSQESRSHLKKCSSPTSMYSIASTELPDTSEIEIIRNIPSAENPPQHLEIKLEKFRELGSENSHQSAALGSIDSKWKKCAWIYTFALDKEEFIRSDRSIDILRARQVISKVIKNSIGSYRDYFGGIIDQQVDVLTEVSRLLGYRSSNADFFLDHFFFQITPALMITILGPQILAQIWYHTKKIIKNTSRQSHSLALYTLTLEQDTAFIFHSYDAALFDNYLTHIHQCLFSPMTSASSQFIALDCNYHILIIRNINQTQRETLKRYWSALELIPTSLQLAALYPNSPDQDS